MKKAKWIISLFLISILLTSLLSGCAKNNKELVLGVVSPLTGSGAASGVIQLNGVKLAVEEINAAGGIETKDGKVKIKMVSEDDEGIPAKSVTVTQKLATQDKMDVMIGALNSSCTLADMQVTAKLKIPQFTPSSTAASITQQGNKYIFRNATPDPTHVASLFKYITQGLKAKNVAILYESTDFGMGGQKLIAEKAKELGVNVTANELYNSGEKDFSVQLTKIKNSNPDVILLWGYYAEAALIAKQMKQYGITQPLMGTGYNSPKLIELGQEAVNGIIFSTPFTAANPDKNVQAFLEKYRKAYNQDPDQNAAQAYDAVYMIADAVKKVGVDKEKIREYIAGMKNFPGVAGVTNFDDKGDVIKDLDLVRIENGKHTLVRY